MRDAIRRWHGGKLVIVWILSESLFVLSLGTKSAAMIANR
jgi:hypothetical protein